MKFEDLKSAVEAKFPGWKLTVNPSNQIITLGHIGYSKQKCYPYKSLLVNHLQTLIDDMQKFCSEAVGETIKNHLEESPTCAHAEIESRIEFISGQIFHLILCSSCGSLVFPKYIPGHIVPLAKPGKPVSIGALSIASQFGNELPHITKSVVLQKSVPVDAPITLKYKYKIEDGEMLVQDGTKWVTAEKAESATKKKSKKADPKPGQRKVKFDHT